MDRLYFQMAVLHNKNERYVKNTQRGLLTKMVFSSNRRPPHDHMSINLKIL